MVNFFAPYYTEFLAFVRSGWIGPSYGAVGLVGNDGYGWSRTAISSSNARVLGFSPIFVGPSSSGVCDNGFPLRCLYPGN